MAYTGKKVHELRTMCLERGLPRDGAKNKLISQLERYDLERVNVKRESMEIDYVDVPALISTASTETGSSQEASTQNTLQPTPQSILPESPSPPESPQSTIDSEEALESVDESSEQRDQSEVTSSLPTSATTSPIIRHASVEMPAPTVNSQQQRRTASSFETPPSTRQPMYESSPCNSSIPNEIDRELLTRLIAERKQLCMMQGSNVHRLYNRGIMINQARNGVQYNYDLLLDIVRSSWVYNDGEIPLWFKEAYDATFGTSYWEANVVSPGINADEIFLLKGDNIQMGPMEYVFLS